MRSPLRIRLFFQLMEIGATGEHGPVVAKLATVAPKLGPASAITLLRQMVELTVLAVDHSLRLVTHLAVQLVCIKSFQTY